MIQSFVFVVVKWKGDNINFQNSQRSIEVQIMTLNTNVSPMNTKNLLFHQLPRFVRRCGHVMLKSTVNSTRGNKKSNVKQWWQTEKTDRYYRFLTPTPPRRTYPLCLCRSPPLRTLYACQTFIFHQLCDMFGVGQLRACEGAGQTQRGCPK